MQYLTYSEYKSMGGSIADTAFNRYEFQSRKQVDYYTQSRLREDTDIRESIKMLMFELVELASKADLTAEQQPTSVSNNGISVSYRQIDTAEFKAEQSKLIMQYLSGEVTNDGTPLLYLGV